MRIKFLNLWTAKIDGHKIIDGILFIYFAITRLELQAYILNLGIIIAWGEEDDI
jgi:hypothetical protein